MIDPFTIKRLEYILDAYIEAKVPHNVRSSVRLIYEWHHNMVTMSEERPVFHERKWRRHCLVQFCLNEGLWSVYAKDKQGSWYCVPTISPNESFEAQLEQVEIDHDGVFWIS